MRAVTPVGATAILILAAEMWACAAGAEDSIIPGKWEFWTVGLKMREPLPGTLLPSQRWGPEGMINSVCLSETNLKTRHSHQRRSMPALHSTLGKGSCDWDRTTDAATATSSMTIDCAWSGRDAPNAVIRIVAAELAFNPKRIATPRPIVFRCRNPPSIFGDTKRTRGFGSTPAVPRKRFYPRPGALAYGRQTPLRSSHTGEDE